MLGDTIVLPVGAINVTCKKINQDAYSSEYMFRSSENQYIVRIRHSKSGKDGNGSVVKDRHNLEIVETVFATATAAEFTRKVYIVWEHLPSDTHIANIDALADMLLATSNALVTALHGWES